MLYEVITEAMSPLQVALPGEFDESDSDVVAPPQIGYRLQTPLALRLARGEDPGEAMERALREARVGLEAAEDELVITSYSIHYTKLYEGGPCWGQHHRGGCRHRGLSEPQGMSPPMTGRFHRS